MSSLRVIFFAIITLFLNGCQTAKNLPKSDFHFYIESNETSANALWIRTATMPVSDLKINICPYPALLAKDVEFAQLIPSNVGQCILFKFTHPASVMLYQLSVESVGRKIVLIFNGQPIGLSMPINSTIMDGTLAIFPEINEDELKSVIKEINDTVVKIKKLKKD
ncbi:MAG: hypothetical protein LBS71_02150 [Puniceicoccales bacterium]|jgi:hypothetical protein|nr:hypothetical protein [Puniceicoccales bacterium]